MSRQGAPVSDQAPLSTHSRNPPASLYRLPGLQSRPFPGTVVCQLEAQVARQIVRLAQETRVAEARSWSINSYRLEVTSAMTNSRAAYVTSDLQQTVTFIPILHPYRTNPNDKLQSRSGGRSVCCPPCRRRPTTI